MAKFKPGDYIKEIGKPYWYLIMAQGKNVYYLFTYPNRGTTELRKDTVDRHCELIGHNVKGSV